MSDPWLPVGFALPQGSSVSGTVATGLDWQIASTHDGGRALVVTPSLAQRWTTIGLLTPDQVDRAKFGELSLATIESGSNHVLSPLSKCNSPSNKAEALAFAAAFRITRSIDATSALEDAVYVERLSRILPTFSEGTGMSDAVILGAWLTGGLRVPAVPIARIEGLLSWLSPGHLMDVVEAAGMAVGERTAQSNPSGGSRPSQQDRSHTSLPEGTFKLPGRALLEAFFNDHVVDAVQNRERYRALGIGNPPAIILQGPPGCGKTFAVEKLVAFLGWPSFGIDASSIASPYIHETSRKVATVFREAIEVAPSVVVIDEMDAFLSQRDGAASGQHRVEEIAEFLRRIPEAIAVGVLIIGMTNRIDLIDPAILRRGRFDHIIAVTYADANEVQALLNSLLSSVPTAGDIDLDTLAMKLAGRPLSDASFVVREAARIAAKARRYDIDDRCLREALGAAADRDPDRSRNRIGFV